MGKDGSHRAAAQSGARWRTQQAAEKSWPDGIPLGHTVASHTNHNSAPWARTALISAAGAFAVFVVGALLETWLVSLLQPSEGELTWISDLVIASTLGVVLYLWLHLQSTRAALVELERHQIVVDTQLQLAAKIQRDLLPAAPPARSGVSWAVQLVPAGRIGGDYYDFIDLEGRSRITIVGDIAGKGIPAAMMLVYVRAVFRQAVRETCEPSAIVSRIANAVYTETRGESYLTCIVARLDEHTRQLTITTGGHPPALVTGTSVRRLTQGGPPAGLFPDAAYEQETVLLCPGNRVIFVTDGITERMAGGFEKAVAGLDGHLSAERLCEAVFSLARGPASAPPIAEWDDDRTAVVLAVDADAFVVNSSVFSQTR
jgi:Stage II sporulation protein E (SpoIIE)